MQGEAAVLGKSQSADAGIVTGNGRLLGLKRRMSYHPSSIKVERFGAYWENALVSMEAYGFRAFLRDFYWGYSE